MAAESSIGGGAGLLRQVVGCVAGEAGYNC
jgi:hypothetical protein